MLTLRRRRTAEDRPAPGPCHRRAARIRPRVDPLEGRTLLSTFTVENLDNDGPGSLRQAILDANARPGTDVINFEPGLNGTITLSSPRLDIDDNLTIDGPGSGLLTVSGGDTTRVFHVFGGGREVEIEGLTIADGRSSQGAGLYNIGSNVTLRDVRFTGNTATGDGSSFGLGGAIWNGGSDPFGGGSIVIEGATFAENAGFGGGSFNGGPFLGVIPGGGGGAIWNGHGASLSIVGSSFLRNSVGEGAITGGGAILNQGLGSSLEVVFSSFVQNEAGGGFLPGSFGGAVGNLDGATATIIAGRFSNNRAVGLDSPGPGFDGGSGLGGGLANLGTGTVQVLDSLFSGNLARGGERGESSSPVIEGGFGLGGGIANSSAAGDPTRLGGFVLVADSALIGNRAVGGDGFDATDDEADGGDGQIGGGGGFYNDLGSVSEIRRTIFSGNLAVSGDGGDGDRDRDRDGSGGAAEGGAIKNIGGLLTLSGGVLSGNAALGGDGGRGGDGLGGGLANLIDTGLDGTFYAGIAEVRDTLFLANSAIGGEGTFGGDGLGGGVFNEQAALLSASSSRFLLNRAEGGSGLVRGGDGLGGGILNQFLASLVLLDGQLLANRAIGSSGPIDGDGLGGGLFVGFDALGGIEGTTFFRNVASTEGNDIFAAFPS